MGNCVRPMFGEGSVYSPEFIDKLMTAFTVCLQQYLTNEEDILGLYSCIDNVMKTQLHVSEVKNMQLSIAVRNGNLLGKFLPRIAGMIVTNSMYLPQRLPSVFESVECLDIDRIELQEMSNSQWNYYGLHIDIARNIQLLLKRFFPSIPRYNHSWKVGRHPIHSVYNSLNVNPTTVFNKLIHRESKWIVVDNFQELKKNKTMLVTDFFVLWPLYHHTLTTTNQNKKLKKSIDEYDKRLDGTSGEILRQLVKSFDMDSEAGYPLLMEGDVFLKR